MHRCSQWPFLSGAMIGRVLAVGGSPQSPTTRAQRGPKRSLTSTNMLTIRLPREVTAIVSDACRNARRRETGGMLFGEHVAEDAFRVVEATVAGKGSFASFLRALASGLARLEACFARTKHEYQRFNYLGEWHSHPSFALYPSGTDDETMFNIVNDSRTSARFAVSLIVKLVDDRLDARAFAYFPGNERQNALVVLEQ